VLVLASRSPQRRAILEQLGIPFEVSPAEVAERDVGEPEDVVRHNAILKARTIAAKDSPAVPVLGVDTVVALDGALYGKAHDEDAARSHLARLSGRTHEVWSGIALIAPTTTRVGATRTLVTFRTLDSQLLDWYVETGEWRERAGAYAIQGRGAALVERIEGDYWNVVGLPVPLLIDLGRDLLSGAYVTRGAPDLPAG
jgi:septum formation protein